MTKLEQKLKELGYEYECLNIYYKEFNKTLVLTIDLYPNLIYGRVHCCFAEFHNQQDIDNLQLAFNEMQRDLEVLKEYENNTREE